MDVADDPATTDTDESAGHPGHRPDKGMYCIVGTRSDDADHPYNDDKTFSNGELGWDSSSCADKDEYLVNENGEEEQISYEICAGVFAANEADIAKLKAAAADAAAARAALKAGLTCSVEDNCVGGDVNVETACVLGDDGDYTCEIKGIRKPRRRSNCRW